ncbi:kallikrein-8-like [Sparus aurata]|uniref:Kallikrein-15-like n=1 Tax=Sparus aurata TaxID=8175 RepID=A0A671VXD5_SPAAU|nr:kallikrein-8-like [Sparus aurata]
MGGLTSLLLLLCVGVTVSTVLDLQKRIIGGHECPAGERGYHVKLVTENGALLCGGSLLKNNWILTAAHCWQWGMKVVVGVHPGPELNPVMITEPPVMYGDKKKIHDIMLLKLPDLVNLPKITPVDLPSDCKKQKPKPLDTVKIAGSAVTTLGEDNKRECAPSDKLQCADIKLSDCTKLKTTHELYSYNHWFCGETSTVDICPGDAGGGVVRGNMIFGVISFMGESEKANAADLGFIDVCEYKDWIKKKTKKPIFG